MGERKLGLKATAGEIVAVQGGHIVRSTGRKDRHSKVCTAKGPRDRRVRLAAHTAIQFYDVQDRLGYDRPSKAVDWLINKAKAAIDELEKLPVWNPTACSAIEDSDPGIDSDKVEDENHRQRRRYCTEEDLGMEVEHRRSSVANNSRAQNSSILPPFLDSDAIDDTIKSVFPIGASIGANTSGIQFQSFSNPDLLSRSGNHSQDPKISSQFQNPILLHSRHTLLSGIPLGFDGTAAWPEHHHQVAELCRFSAVSGGAAASFDSPPPPQPMLQQLFGNEQLFSQRGPLQSSNTPSIRAWIDPSPATISMADYSQPQPHHHHPGAVPIHHPSSLSGTGSASGFGSFSRFQIPARIQGDEEEHDGYSDKPSSASSKSRR